MTAGMSLAGRDAARSRYRDEAIRAAALKGMTMRCQGLQHDLLDPDHRLCRGEQPGNAGCLCRCHDNLIASRKKAS